VSKKSHNVQKLCWLWSYTNYNQSYYERPNWCHWFASWYDICWVVSVHISFICLTIFIKYWNNQWRL